jgi:predicted GNAT family N-acyltransferase
VEFEGLRFRRANTSQQARALAQREVIFCEELAHSGGDAFDAQAAHLVALAGDDEVVAALRVIEPGPAALELEQFVGLGAIIPADRRPAQVGSFWVLPAHRQVRRNRFVQLGMLKLAIAYAERIAATDLLMWSSVARLQALYRRAHFATVPALDFVHPVAGPAYVMRLDLVSLRAQLDSAPRPMLRFLLCDPLPGFDDPPTP